MKNVFLKTIVFVIIFVCAFFFWDIVNAFYILSDVCWTIFNFDLLAVVLGAVFLAVFIGFTIYFLFHREKKEEIVTPVEFKSPDDMSPMEVGFLVDGVLDSSDLSAMIVFWASKQYVEISGDKDKQKLKKLKELPENTPNYEKVLFKQIFGKATEVYVESISRNLDSVAVMNVVKQVEKSVGDGYFNKKAIHLRDLFVGVLALIYLFTVFYFRLEFYIDIIPIVETFAIVSTCLYLLVADYFLKYYDYRHKNNSTVGRTVSLISLVVLLATMGGLCVYFFHTDVYQFVILLCMLGLMFLSCFLSSKIQIYSREGIKKLGQILGFKSYIEVTKKDRIKTLVKQNPSLYFDVLPYAYVLGVNKEWIENLTVLHSEYPRIVNNDMMTNVSLSTIIITNHTLNFVRMINLARYSHIINFASKINIGGGSGGNKPGSSNFGGIRRR